MDNNGKVTYTGVSTVGLLGVTFVVLKLLGKIKWSWLWVTAPFWIPVVLTFIGCVIVMIYVECFMDRKYKSKGKFDDE